MGLYFFPDGRKKSTDMTILELVEEYRNGNSEIFTDIADRMRPLLNHYAYRLYTWEKEDAQQEMILALLEGIRKMKYCHSEGECIRYFETCIYRTYTGIIKKEQKERNRAEWKENQVGDSNDWIGICERYMDLKNYIRSLEARKRKIAEEIITSGKKDQEIADTFHVTRQYVNKIRKELRKKVFVE